VILRWSGRPALGHAPDVVERGLDRAEHAHGGVGQEQHTDAAERPEVRRLDVAHDDLDHLALSGCDELGEHAPQRLEDRVLQAEGSGHAEDQRQQRDEGEQRRQGEGRGADEHTVVLELAHEEIAEARQPPHDAVAQTRARRHRPPDRLAEIAPQPLGAVAQHNADLVG
jgi:hypothetical protein